MTEAQPRKCPFVGLMPYSEEDWEFFVGRDSETEIVIANMAASRLTLFYGASGVGKSSVLRAGVAHQLETEARENRAARGSPELALTVFSSWRDDPVAGLAREVRAAVARSTGRDPGPLPERGSLLPAFAAWTEFVGGDLFIILDQFEEYFLYHGSEDGDGTFAVEFPRLVNREGLRVNFLISIREDAVARLDHFKGRIPRLFANYLRLQHLGLEAAEQAIREPLARFNHLYPDDAVSIEDGLVREVLQQTRSGQVRVGQAVAIETPEGQDVRVETPFLQLVMTRLWDEERAANSRVLRLDTFTNAAKLGGADKIVRTHLDREMQKLLPAEQDVAAAAFRYLVTRTGSKIALGVEDLAGYTSLPTATLAAVLEKLTGGERRILRPMPVPDRSDLTRYEIFHDVLGPAMADWRRRHEAAQEQQAIRQNEEERRREELSAAEARRELERARFIKKVAVVLVVAIALSIGAAIFAYHQWRKAEANLISATEAKGHAEDAKVASEKALKATKQALQVAQAALQSAEEQSRFASRAIADPFRAAEQVDAQTSAAIVSRAEKSGAAAGQQLRDTFVTAHVQQIVETATRLGRVNATIRFRADRSLLKDYGTAERPIYEFSLWPVANSMPGGLSSLSTVTYKLDHPSFKIKLLQGDPGQGFRAFYVGWGSMARVPVLLEYRDAGRPPEVAVFAMADSVQARVTMGPLEGSTNRQGHDLAPVGIQTNSAPECSDMCRDNTSCVAMTWVKFPDRNGGMCWQKDNAGVPTPNSAMVSAVKH